MSKRKQTWDNYKEKVAKQRRNDKGAAAAAGGSDGITVQSLSSQVEGKCQKYSKIRPLTLVPLDQEPSLENIKKACQLHFNTDLVYNGVDRPTRTPARVENSLFIACEQALLFGRTKRVSRERASERRRELARRLPFHSLALTSVCL